MYTTLSVLAIGLSVIVVSSSNTIYSLMYLIALFLTVASLLIAQGITYVGLLYIVVYVGAIAILFLFVVMMINVRDTELNTTGSRYTQNFPLTILLGSIFLYLVSTSEAISLSILSVPLDITANGWQNLTMTGLTDLSSSSDAFFSSGTIVQAIGISLYTWGSIWLILAAAILLLCMVGPIVLTLRPQHPSLYAY